MKSENYEVLRCKKSKVYFSCRNALESRGRQSGTGGLLGVVKDLKIPHGFNAIYVYALPDKK